MVVDLIFLAKLARAYIDETFELHCSQLTIMDTLLFIYFTFLVCFNYSFQGLYRSSTGN